MKSFALPKTICIGALVFGVLSALHAADVTGQWKSEFEVDQIGQLKYTYDLNADGEKITGKAIRSQGDQTATNEVSEGKIKGDEISFVENLKIQDQDIRIEYSGKINGDEIKLTRKVGDFGTKEIVAKRVKAAAVSVAGKWQSEFESGVGHQKYLYDFKLDGDKLTGQAVRELESAKTTNAITGKVTGGDIAFTEPLKIQDQDITVEYSGKIDGDEIKLTRKVGDFATTEIVAKRLKDTK